MIIDAHNHPDWLGHNLNKFISNMKKYHIDKTWLLSWECPGDEYLSTSDIPLRSTGSKVPLPITSCLSYAKRAPDKFILGYAPDPRKPDAVEKFLSAVIKYGVRICGEVKFRMMYDNPDALRLFRICGEKKIPVVIHLEYPSLVGKPLLWPDCWYGGEIETFERVIKACPKTIFLGHAMGFWSHISGDDLYDKVDYPKGKIKKGGKIISMLRKYPNLYCDMSAISAHNALSRDRKFARNFLMEFQDRVLYARDRFDNVHQELINSFKLPAKVIEKIYYKNALKLVPV